MKCNGWKFFLEHFEECLQKMRLNRDFTKNDTFYARNMDLLKSNSKNRKYFDEIGMGLNFDLMNIEAA